MSYEIEIYKLDVITGNFSRIDVITTFQGLSFYNKLSGISACQFTLNVYDGKATATNLTRYVNQAVVKRDGEIEFIGPIARVTGDYSNVAGSIKVQCYSYLAHLAERYTDKLKQYSDVEQCDLAWDLVDSVQSRTAGQLGIVEGTTPNSVTRDRTYEYSEIAHALINLSNVINGFDFSFDTTVDSDNKLSTVVFNCFYPYRGTVRDDLQTLKIGDNAHRVVFTTKTDLLNSGIAEGAGTGTPIITTKNFFHLQEAYTRRELILQRKDISVRSTLELRLEADLTADSVEGYDLDITTMDDKKPVFSDYHVGDILLYDLAVEGSGGYVDFKGRARVIELAVSVDQVGAETVTPKLEIIG